MAFEYLLNLTPLLDKADQRCKYVNTTCINYDWLCAEPQEARIMICMLLLFKMTDSALKIFINTIVLAQLVRCVITLLLFVCVCSCDCLSLLLQECNKLGLLSEANTASLTAKRYGQNVLFLFFL